jgi:hypothetical protein
MRLGLYGILIASAACTGSVGDGNPDGGGSGSNGDHGPGGDAGEHDPRPVDAGVDAPASLTPHEYCVQQTNHYRTTVPPPGTGAPRSPVTESAQLEAFADTGAMVDYGSSPHNHFIMTNGGGTAFAENECPHWDLSSANGDLKMLVAACLAAFYSEGPGGGHYENMMGAYHTLGCGIYQHGTDVTIVQDYGY